MKAEIIRITENCRVCGKGDLKPVWSLGDLYVSDFLDADAKTDESAKAPLEVVFCDTQDGGCGLLQLKHTVSHEAMYRNYWYRSGINQTMHDELADVVKKVKQIVPLHAGDSVIDIGSNDSTMLRLYEVEGLKTIGFEPAKNLVEKYGREGVTRVITDFFNAESWKKEYGDAKAKVITAIAMFYDLDDPNKFVTDMVDCLDEGGLIIIQMLYLPSFLKRNAFDGICHEHLEYYSLFSLENLLKRHGLEVFDAEYRAINEGTLRFYIRKKDSKLEALPGAENRLAEFRNEEKTMQLEKKEAYSEFVGRVDAIKEKVNAFIDAELTKGKKIYGYGASTKGNTLLQYFGLDETKLIAIADRNPDKWGKKTVGTNIPIISEEDARNENPDYFFILPWHFLPEFKEREEKFFKSGGGFIIPLPEFEILRAIEQ